MAVKGKKRFIALDLGTSKIVVYISGKGIVYNQSSKVAYDTRTNEAIRVGNDADLLDGKTSKQIRVEYPIIEGVINDMRVTEDMLSLLAKKIELPSLWKNSLVLIACPSSVTELEKSSLKSIIESLGAHSVLIKEAIQLAALGANLDYFSPKGNLIIDIGSGTTDVAIVSAGDSVISKSIKLSGSSIDRELMIYVRTKYNIVIGSTVVNMIKLRLGCLEDYNPVKIINVFGRDAVSGLPKEIQLSSTEVNDIFRVQFVAVTDVIVQILEQTPADLTYDVVRNGMTIVGGMSKIKGIRSYLENIFRFKVNLIPDPELAVINGAIKLEADLPRLLHDARLEKAQDYKIK